MRDASFALRLLRRNPAFTVVAILTLALGIGANTLVFTLFDAVVLRPLPYHDPDRLYMLWTVEAESHRAMNSTYPDFAEWRAKSRSFSSMAAFQFGSFNLTGGADPERVDALSVTPGLFELLGIRPTSGRPFTADDPDRAALVSERVSKRRAIGGTIQLDGKAYTVLGILPEAFHFPPVRFSGDPEIFVPAIPRQQRNSWYLCVIGRLRPGVPEAQARAELNAIAAGQPTRGQGVSLDPIQRYVTAGTRETTLVLMGAVGFVLLIACTNLANLLLSQGAARRRELAIRAAVGASRARLVRQLVLESLMLAALGAAAGLVVARIGLPLIAAAAPERTAFFTRVRDSGMHLNATVFAFTAGIALASTLLFGLLPALRSTAPVRSPRQGRLRGALIAVEVAVAFVLLTGAGLMVNSMVRLLGEDLGFRSDHLLTLALELPSAKYPAPEDRAAFFERAQQSFEALPGVIAAGAIEDLPLTREYSLNTMRVGPLAGRAYLHSAGPEYFTALGVPLLAGRLFARGENAPVAVINRSMAEKYWPHASPLGQTVTYFRRPTEQPVEVIGIVADVRMIGRDEMPRPELFVPFALRPSSGMSFALRTAGPPEPLIATIKKEIARIDPDEPITDVRTMDALASADLAERRFVLALIGAFALTAIVLAAVGIYGVVSYSVRQRTHEIGIRMALGARRGDVIGLVLRQTALWIALGMAAGAAGSAALTSLLAAHLYGVKPQDPATFALAAAALLLTGLASHTLPARHATRIDPITALRYE